MYVEREEITQDNVHPVLLFGLTYSETRHPFIGLRIGKTKAYKIDTHRHQFRIVQLSTLRVLSTCQTPTTGLLTLNFTVTATLQPTSRMQLLPVSSNGSRY